MRLNPQVPASVKRIVFVLNWGDFGNTASSWRCELTEAVRAIIGAGQSANESTIRSLMPVSVVNEDQPRFVAMVLEEFKTLHAGNAIRFGVSPLEFAAWAGR